MQLDEKISIIEAILFASGDPVEIEKLSFASGTEQETIPKLVKMLSDRYEETKSALVVIKLNNSYQLATKSEYADYIRNALETKRSAPLSSAALEVLTIVAYNQPVTKSFIEHIRGVDSSGIVNSLIEKNLLEEAGRLDVPGRPIAYRTTDNFLRCFKLSSLDDLPVLPDRSEQVSFDEITV
ncbi:MAG: scpB [Oscillospiraceae bacterium]|jgi:segregation and condensation protein B|nr:scpB [Oscillospiraceae bacterium]